MQKCYIDFESRSRADIWATGAWCYSRHPSTEIMCFAYAVDNEDPVIVSPLEAKKPGGRLLELIRSGAEFHAHNAYFERSMWANIMVARHGWPAIPLKKWRCTAAKALSHGLPKSLDEAAKALGVAHLKDAQGKRTMLKVARSEGIVPAEDLQILFQYCKQDVLVERDIDHALPDLHPYEQRVWFLDQIINDNGVAVDIPVVQKAIEVIGIETEALQMEIAGLTQGELDGVSRRNAVMYWLKKKGLDMENLQKATVAKAVETAGGATKRVLEIRQQLNLTSNAKYQALVDATDTDGRLRDHLLYHSAITGRWGGKLVQVQNLPRGLDIDTNAAIDTMMAGGYETLSLIYGPQLLNVMSSCIRGMFVPTMGCRMFITDFAAIEARVLFWLADDKTGLKMFRDYDADPSVPDPYVQMARRIYGNNKLTKADKKERFLGKTTILGSGYGMGIQKFVSTVQAYGMGISDDVAGSAVQHYRSTFVNVPAFWNSMETSAKTCVLTKQSQQVGRLVWYLGGDAPGAGDFLYLRLPTGRSIAYHKPRIEDGSLTYMATDVQTKRYAPKETYGGRLVENCLTGDTLVLTMRGCVPIIDITKEDKVWDGENWVTTDGTVKRGIKETGLLDGIRVTADHKILVGNLWKSAIELDESSWQDALKPGLSSVAFACLKAELGTTVKPFADVLAAVGIVLGRAIFFGENTVVRPAVTCTQARLAASTTPSCHSPCSVYGCTGTPELCPGVLRKPVRLIKTMEAAVLKYTNRGSKIAGFFWSLLNHCPGGKIPGLTSTESITTEIIHRITFGLFRDKKARTTLEKPVTYATLANAYQSWCSGEITARGGKVEKPFTTTSKMERPPKKLWKSTGEREEVYDLLNCGPLNRFMIISASGPVIVHNCTQAVARDLMVEAMLKFAAEGYRILFTVHDELVLEHPKGSVDDVLRIMRSVPSWAQGCPVNAEAIETTRYKK